MGPILLICAWSVICISFLLLLSRWIKYGYIPLVLLPRDFLCLKCRELYLVERSTLYVTSEEISMFKMLFKKTFLRSRCSNEWSRSTQIATKEKSKYEWRSMLWWAYLFECYVFEVCCVQQGIIELNPADDKQRMIHRSKALIIVLVDKGGTIEKSCLSGRVGMWITIVYVRVCCSMFDRWCRFESSMLAKQVLGIVCRN